MELNEKWKLTTQNNAYLWEGNQISKQNRYPWCGKFDIVTMVELAMEDKTVFTCNAFFCRFINTIHPC